MGSVIAPREDQNMEERQEVCESFPAGKEEIGTHRGIGETAENGDGKGRRGWRYDRHA
jgi:hypothetical protein